MWKWFRKQTPEELKIEQQRVDERKKEHQEEERVSIDKIARMRVKELLFQEKIDRRVGDLMQERWNKIKSENYK